MTGAGGKILWNNRMYSAATFRKYSEIKHQVVHDNYYNVAAMVRSCVSPLELTKSMIFTGRAREFDENLAFLLGVMQWHNDSYIFRSECSNKDNADNFLKFIKYYMEYVLHDTDGFIHERLILIITKGMYHTISDAGHDAASNYYCNQNKFVGGIF